MSKWLQMWRIIEKEWGMGYNCLSVHIVGSIKMEGNNEKEKIIYPIDSSGFSLVYSKRGLWCNRLQPVEF